MSKAFADSEYGLLREVLLCSPSDASWGISNAAFPDLHEAMQQHENLVETLQGEGILCHFLPINPSAPYQSYTRDSFVITPWGLVLAKMGFKPRQTEPLAIENFASNLGLPVWKIISSGSLEGGDIQLLCPGHVAVGSNGDRTTMAASKQVQAWFENRGWCCRIIPYPPQYMHLDTAMGALDSKNILCCDNALSVSDLNWLESLNFTLHFVPEKEAKNMICNTVSLGKKRVLTCSQNKLGNAYLEKLGFQVLAVNISQFVRDSGGVHCLVNPLLRDPTFAAAPSPFIHNKMEPFP